MSDTKLKKIEEINMMKFFDQELEDWRSKMIKIYGDQHPYTFYVTAGHDFEDMILKITDIDAPARETRKHEPFRNLEKIFEVDRKAENDFCELLSKMEGETPTTEMKETLEKKKRECAKVFHMFDEIVSVCKEYFELEYSDCSKRASKQTAFQEPIISEVERFLVDVEEFGSKEIKSLRKRISEWMYDKGMKMLDDVDESYDRVKTQPFAMTVWFECTDILSSKKLRNAFLSDQRHMTDLWKKAFDDLLKLSAKLEKCRCDYSLMKFKLEREIFWMSRDYKERMPELTKIQRHLSNLVDEKVILKFQMKDLLSEFKREQKTLIEVQNKMCRKIMLTKASNKFAHNSAVKKFQSVLDSKKEEIYNYLIEILKGDQLIYEEILGVSWEPVDLSHLKPEDVEEEENKKDIFSVKLKKMKAKTSKRSNDDNEDNFSTAFQILIASEHFETLLNMIADELGYSLDFCWVNYVKEKLELTQEVKWLELFRVFKINFVQDLRELKDHMMSYCKFGDNKEIVFDIEGAVNGFLHFIWNKRQLSSEKMQLPAEYDSKEYENYWTAAKSLIPKSLLWENIENILFQYWELLEDRSKLLKEKLNLIAENNGFENCLENYHKYGTF